MLSLFVESVTLDERLPNLTEIEVVLECTTMCALLERRRQVDLHVSLWGDNTAHIPPLGYPVTVCQDCALLLVERGA